MHWDRLDVKVAVKYPKSYGPRSGKEEREKRLKAKKATKAEKVIPSCTSRAYYILPRTPTFYVHLVHESLSHGPFRSVTGFFFQPCYTGAKCCLSWGSLLLVVLQPCCCFICFSLAILVVSASGAVNHIATYTTCNPVIEFFSRRSLIFRKESDFRGRPRNFWIGSRNANSTQRPGMN